MRRDDTLNVTYADIARRAGVSTATVSRVLAGNGGVSADRRLRVTQAAENLGYRTNRAARALRRNRSDTIGLVISDIEYPPIARLARVIETEAAKHGFGLMICNTDESLARQSFYIDLLLQERVAGVIAMPATDDPDQIRALLDGDTPTVTVDRIVTDDNTDCVLIDNAAATHALVTDLLGHSRRRFLGIFGTQDATPSRERLDAVRAQLASRPDVALDVSTLTLGSTIGIAQATDRISAVIRGAFGPRSFNPDAIICSNAMSVQIVMKTLSARGIHVPQDVAVVGYDDMTGLDLFYSPVTVADQPFEKIGRRALELLIDRMDGNRDTPQRIIRIQPDIRFRQSCGGEHHRPLSGTNHQQACRSHRDAS